MEGALADDRGVREEEVVVEAPAALVRLLARGGIAAARAAELVAAALLDLLRVL